jgi:threonine dehydratase
MRAIRPGSIVEEVEEAAARIDGVALHTPLQRSERLSKRYAADVYLKREDLQPVLSFKLRGAFNKVVSLGSAARAQGLVCASAGNHAQGVAFAASRLGIAATIFMPTCTPDQKVHRVLHFGGEHVVIRLVGETFDEAGDAAAAHAAATGALVVPPFDDPMTIAGQGTIARELLVDLREGPDLVLAGVGGGGLAAGIAGYLRWLRPRARIVGAEPAGAPSMTEAMLRGRPVRLPHIDHFVDGAAVQEVGRMTFDIIASTLDRMLVVHEGEICSALLDLYQDDGIIAEPAGALAIAALGHLGAGLRGKSVVCILSGGNNDVHRYPEILERALAFEYGRKNRRVIETRSDGPLRGAA